MISRSSGNWLQKPESLEKRFKVTTTPAVMGGGKKKRKQKMNKAIWFSRHEMTAEQAAEIAAAGYEVVKDSKFTEFAGHNMTSDEEVMETIKYMMLLRNSGVQRFYGVFPPVLRAKLLAWTGTFGGNTLELWEAWNVQRSPNGGKPSFEHKKFVLTFRG